MASSLFIVRAANPMFTRSRTETMYKTSRKGKIQI